MYVQTYNGLGQGIGPDISRVLQKLPQRVPINLDRFLFDRHTLTPRLERKVDRFASEVVKSWQTSKPIQTIYLIGHADDRGSHTYNDNLGERRAQSVKRRLVGALDALQAGLSKQIQFKVGTRGKRQPAARRKTRAARRRNRRVEVLVWRAPKKSPPARRGPQQPRISTELPESTKKRLKEQFRREAERRRLTEPGPTLPPGTSLREKAREKARDYLRSQGIPSWATERILDLAEKGAWRAVESVFKGLGHGSEFTEAAVSTLQALVQIRYRF
jgi:hypothetical protein